MQTVTNFQVVMYHSHSVHSAFHLLCSMSKYLFQWSLLIKEYIQKTIFHQHIVYSKQLKNLNLKKNLFKFLPFYLVDVVLL